jgi:hypothetical protein
VLASRGDLAKRADHDRRVLRDDAVIEGVERDAAGALRGT